MYTMSQMVNWWGAVAWAGFIFSLVKGKSWALPLGVFASAMSMFGGFPVGVTDVFVKDRFSMFLVAPTMGTIMLALFMLPGIRSIAAGQVKHLGIPA
jgi:hypothetical protein